MSPLVPEQRAGGHDDWSNPEIVRALANLAEQVRQLGVDLRADITGLRREFVPRETIAAWREQTLERLDTLERESMRMSERQQLFQLQMEAEKAERLEREAERAAERTRFVIGQIVAVVLALAAIVATLAIAFN